MKKYLEFINEHVNWQYKLIVSAKDGNLEGVKQALDNGADIHYINDWALRWTSKYNHLEVVKYLIEQGANIHAKNDYALRAASQRGNIDVVKYLCEFIIQNEPWYIPKIMKYIPDGLKEKYPHLFAASDMDLL